ncbi:hypothetical protein ACFL1H_07500 [Nanoarchaeota archaeon]
MDYTKEIRFKEAPDEIMIDNWLYRKVKIPTYDGWGYPIFFLPVEKERRQPSPNDFWPQLFTLAKHLIDLHYSKKQFEEEHPTMKVIEGKVIDTDALLIENQI